MQFSLQQWGEGHIKQHVYVCICLKHLISCILMILEGNVCKGKTQNLKQQVTIQGSQVFCIAFPMIPNISQTSVFSEELRSKLWYFEGRSSADVAAPPPTRWMIRCDVTRRFFNGVVCSQHDWSCSATINTCNSGFYSTCTSAGAKRENVKHPRKMNGIQRMSVSATRDMNHSRLDESAF